MSVDVETVQVVNDEVVEAFGRLLPQLSPHVSPPDHAALKRLVEWQGIRVLAARVEGRIMGMLTLVMFPIPTGIRAWIEDEIVDQTVRGRGVRTALAQEAVRLARLDGARTVDLTSPPSREAANRRYERLGFEVRDAQVYRLVESPAPTAEEHQE
jgi:GNAT superfamily N-acetyltransferase